MSTSGKSLPLYLFALVFALPLFYTNCSPIGDSGRQSRSLSSTGAGDSFLEGAPEVGLEVPGVGDELVDNENPVGEEPEDLKIPGPNTPETGAGKLFFGGFENGELNSNVFTDAWGLRYGTFPQNGQLVSDPNLAFEGKSLMVRYPGSVLGRNQRVGFGADLQKLNIGYRDAAYLRYFVKFHPGWEFVKGGKLPGLSGVEQISGGDPANGANGWSTRFMWRANGLPVVYAYLPGKYQRSFGFDFKMIDPDNNQEQRLPVGEWVCLEQYIELNDVGQANGKIRAWLNDELSLNISDATFRTVNNENTKIGMMLFSTFFGGNDDTWAPSKDVFASYDNFIISDQPIGCD